jgi:hypothetical protein
VESGSVREIVFDSGCFRLIKDQSISIRDLIEYPLRSLCYDAHVVSVEEADRWRKEMRARGPER